MFTIFKEEYTKNFPEIKNSRRNQNARIILTIFHAVKKSECCFLYEICLQDKLKIISMLVSEHESIRISNHRY